MSNEWWEDDYKLSFLEEERLRQEKSTAGWIYVGVDVRSNDIAKIGLTTKQLWTRASSSQNPCYALLCGFKVKEGVQPDSVRHIEQAVIEFLESNFERINHYNSDRPSEWFKANPVEVRALVHDFLYENFGSYMLSYYCNERDIGIIHSWENKHLLVAGSRMPYVAADLSNPPPSVECLFPPGCGNDCDCWGT